MTALSMKRGALARRPFGLRVRPPSRNDHIYLFSSPENARRLREAIEDSIANRNMIPFDVDELRRELGLEQA
jgi:hypothetical protein